MHIVHKGNQFNEQMRERICLSFTFNYDSHDSGDKAMSNFLGELNTHLDKEQEKENVLFIISDGRINKENVRKSLKLLS